MIYVFPLIIALGFVDPPPPPPPPLTGAVDLQATQVGPTEFEFYGTVTVSDGEAMPSTIHLSDDFATIIDDDVKVDESGGFSITITLAPGTDTNFTAEAIIDGNPESDTVYIFFD